MKCQRFHVRDRTPCQTEWLFAYQAGFYNHIVSLSLALSFSCRTFWMSKIHKNHVPQNSGIQILPYKYLVTQGHGGLPDLSFWIIIAQICSSPKQNRSRFQPFRRWTFSLIFWMVLEFWRVFLIKIWVSRSNVSFTEISIKIFFFFWKKIFIIIFKIFKEIIK